MKKLFLLLLLIGLSVEAQDYETAVGIRGPWGFGLSAKQALSNGHMIEGIVNFRYNSLQITGLYEVHKPLNVDGLYWYYGGGGHIGFWSSGDFDGLESSGSVIGIDGVLGLDYTFRDVPLNISMDWKPVIHLIGYNGFWGDAGGIGIRYILR